MTSSIPVEWLRRKLWHASRDKMDKAFWANYLATNARRPGNKGRDIPCLITPASTSCIPISVASFLFCASPFLTSQSTNSCPTKQEWYEWRWYLRSLMRLDPSPRILWEGWERGERVCVCVCEGMWGREYRVCVWRVVCVCAHAHAHDHMWNYAPFCCHSHILSHTTTSSEIIYREIWDSFWSLRLLTVLSRP